MTDKTIYTVDDLKADIDKINNEVSHLSEEITSLKQLMQIGLNESNQKFSLMENLVRSSTYPRASK